MDGRTDRRTDGRTDRWTDRRMVREDGQTEGKNVVRIKEDSQQVAEEMCRCEKVENAENF